MSSTIIQLSALQPLEKLRVRTRGAYRGTVTEPGTLVSDGKLIFAWDRVPEDRRPFAEEVAARPAEEGRRIVSQSEAEQVFEGIALAAAKRARVLGQIEKPLTVNASRLDHVAVLRYGRGGSTGYVLLDAHRLLLLHHLTDADEVLCEGPSLRVLLRRKGKPVGGMTALAAAFRIEP